MAPAQLPFSRQRRNPLVHQLQRRDELAFEQVAATAVIAEARQRLEQIGAAGDRAVAGFVALDRHQHRRIDAVARLIARRPS